MSFSPALVYDFIFLAVFSFAAVKSWQKGFLAGLTELIGAVLGVGIASWGSRTLAPEVYLSFFSDSVSTRVEQAVAQSGGDIAAAVQGLDFLPESIRAALAAGLQTAGDQLPEKINALLEPLFLPLVQAVLFVLLLGACALPAQPVLEHVYDSAQTIQQEGLYPEYFGFKLFQMDNYTDTIMLFEAAAMGEQDPLTAMMTATAYNVDNFETMAGDLAVYCERTIPLATGAQKAVQLVPFSYARYWHGYLIWLRPLLCVMSITGVRVVQYLVLFALLAVILWQLRRQCGLRAMVWFAVSQLAVTVFWVPHQVQYFTTFCIAYAGCAWVLARPRRAGQLSIALVVLGTCTAFCDLLVTPIITLGLPVAVWLCCLPQRAASGARQCLPVIGGSLCWGAGYAMCWGLKWVLATLITGQDIIGDAIHQAGVRTTADTWHGMELSWGNIFRFVGDTLSQRGLLWPVVLVVILCIAAFLLCLRNKEALLRALPIGLTALMAPVWLALLRTHSIQHGWFTWRSLTVSIFAGLAFLYYSCGIRAGLRRLRGQKQQG